MDTKVNIRTLPQESMPYPLEAFRETGVDGNPRNYPGFGWEGYCVDRAISTDSSIAIRWLHEHGVIEPETKTVFNTPIRKLCEERAPECANALKDLGYPL